jgi:hypothetical protein
MAVSVFFFFSMNHFFFLRILQLSCKIYPSTKQKKPPRKEWFWPLVIFVGVGGFEPPTTNAQEPQLSLRGNLNDSNSNNILMENWASEQFLRITFRGLLENPSSVAPVCQFDLTS